MHIFREDDVGDPQDALEPAGLAFIEFGYGQTRRPPG